MGCVFSENLEVQLGVASPPGGAEGWRAVTRVLRSCAAAPGHAARFLRDDAITTGFPADCRVCDGPMTAWTPVPVCDACVGRVAGGAYGVRAALCGVCGEALGMESARFAAAQGATACTACRLVPPAFAAAVAYAGYDDELRDMLHLLKYERMRGLAEAPLGGWLAEPILRLEAQAAREVLVVAVPLFPARERARGFNQSVLLAEAALRRLRTLRPGWKLRAAHGLLRRTRDTEAQFSLQPRARRRNLRGAFAVAEEAAPRGRDGLLDVLLIDDIMTTGATARECARVLAEAGAARVWVATVARAQAEAADAVSSGMVARWGEGSVQTQFGDPSLRSG